MRKDSLAQLLERQPGLHRILHECACCHTVGLKPGILDTKHGDYGMRQVMKGKYEELHIGANGLCSQCTEETELDRNENGA